MRLAALSPSAWALGAVLLLAVLGLLHLLRVRLRRVDVDTLLFFRLAGAVRQPRVLPGRPARLWAFVLGSAAVLAAWTAFGDPRGSANVPSRIVLLEPASGAERPARLLAAAELARQGLGPRGAVVVADATCAVLRAADEPADALELRAAALPPQASPAGTAAALRAAADRLRPGDELVYVGANPPELALAHPLRRVPRGGSPSRLLALRWRADPEPEVPPALRLVVDLTHRGGGRLVLRAAGQELAATLLPSDAGASQVALGPVALGTAALGTAALGTAALGTAALGTAGLELQLLEAGDPVLTVAVPAPTATPARVHVAADVPPEPARALRAALALDSELSLVAEPGAADVLVAGSDPQDPRPALVVSPGNGSGARLPLATAACPLSLSLRDRTRRDAPALPALLDPTVWIEDAQQGMPLVAATRQGGRLRVHAVAWLLAPATHADVPVLLLGALRLLAGRPAEALALAGAPLVLPAAWADAQARDTTDRRALASDGAYRVIAGPAAEAVLTTAAGAVRVHALTVVAAEPAGAALPPAGLTPLGGAGQWWPWLVVVLFAALLCDALLFHRGRLP